MEFFKLIKGSTIDATQLKKTITIKNLTSLCSLINSVTHKSETQANIYCLWGAFEISREELKYGVRFSLLNCPHALAWTITHDNENKSIIVHCTTDKSHQDVDFSDSIEDFIEDWKTGIINQFSLVKKPTPDSE